MASEKMCPTMGRICIPDCQFYFNGECLVAEYYKIIIKSTKISLEMFQPMLKNLLRDMIGLPPEIKDELPENIRKQIEDILGQING